MAGSAFFAAIVVIAGALLAIFATPIFLVPAALLVLAILFAAPLLAAVGARTAGSDGSAAPTTRQATYDPVSPPEERRVV